jgi:tetratricopeptide (TPR) repeat protein
MSDLLDQIADQLCRFTHAELVDMVCDWLAGLDEREQTRFLNRVVQGPRPLVAEAMGLGGAGDLLDEIEALRQAIADGEYVEYGAGYDPDYGAYRGFGDDSWIEALDDLFDAATSFFRAGQFEAAVDAYLALFEIFALSHDGFHFTRPDPVEALRTDIDAVKENLFIAIGRCELEPAVRAIEVSENLYYYGAHRYALLDAWQGWHESHPESAAGLMEALEVALIAYARQPAPEKIGLLSHTAKLLREFYHRYRALSDFESLCRQVGPQQGWPYEDLVERYLEQQNWEQALAWAEDGLSKLPADNHYRIPLQRARGQALLHLDRPAEALEGLQALFRQRPWEAQVYLKLRQAAQAVHQWRTLYPQLTAEMQAHVLTIKGQTSYPVVILTEACLLGYAYLLEGEWQKAVAWASTSGIPAGWKDEDLAGTVATGLLRMGLAAQDRQPDQVLAETLRDAPQVIRTYGAHLEPVARTLTAAPLLDGAVQLYKSRVKQAAAGKNRHWYAQAGAYCQVIRSIRRVQGREADFERYYQDLFATYSRYSALKDELRKAIEGRGRSARAQR